MERKQWKNKQWHKLKQNSTFMRLTRKAPPYICLSHFLSFLFLLGSQKSTPKWARPFNPCFFTWRSRETGAWRKPPDFTHKYLNRLQSSCNLPAGNLVFFAHMEWGKTWQDCVSYRVARFHGHAFTSSRFNPYLRCQIKGIGDLASKCIKHLHGNLYSVILIWDIDSVARKDDLNTRIDCFNEF